VKNIFRAFPRLKRGRAFGSRFFALKKQKELQQMPQSLMQKF